MVSKQGWCILLIISTKIVCPIDRFIQSLSIPRIVHSTVLPSFFCSSSSIHPLVLPILLPINTATTGLARRSESLSPGPSRRSASPLRVPCRADWCWHAPASPSCVSATSPSAGWSNTPTITPRRKLTNTPRTGLRQWGSCSSSTSGWVLHFPWTFFCFPFTLPNGSCATGWWRRRRRCNLLTNQSIKIERTNEANIDYWLYNNEPIKFQSINQSMRSANVRPNCPRAQL